MGLPVYATWLGNIKGPKGDDGEKGRPGTFDDVSYEVVAPHEPLRVSITGDRGQFLHMEVPRGLPGVNGVPADSAVGTYARTPGTQTHAAVVDAVAEGGAAAFADPESDMAQAAAALFPVYRVWDSVSGSYPARVPGAKNIFFGPVDPGLVADPVVDVWEPGDSTSIASVTAALLDPSSDVYAAAQAVSGGRVPLQLHAADGTTLVREVVGASPSRMMGWKFPQANNILFATAPVPLAWENVRVRVRWMHTASGATGSIRLGCEIVPYAPGGGGAGAQLQNTVGLPNANTVAERMFTGSNPVTPGGGVTVGIARFGGSSLDTFAGDIYILDATLERQ